MAASEALSVPGEGTAAGADPAAQLEPAVVTKSSAGPQFRTQLIPIAQLVAVVLGVFAIIWNQQQTTDSLRTELRAEISGLRAEVSENGERLARIEGFLGIGIPDARVTALNGGRAAG